MRVLVAGGAGFIGSHLCHRLVGNGEDVICIDNLMTGTKENVEHLLNKPNFTFIEHDVTEPLGLGIKVDQIYHLASPASPDDYTRLPIETLMANSVGTYNLLELARRNNAKMLLASTSEVYGDPEVNPQLETYWGNVNPVGPRSCYDESKRFAESLSIFYLKIHRISATIIRIFNTYGSGMRETDKRAVPSFINQALKGTPITVYGDGLQTRSFCYIDDVINGLIQAMSVKEANGQIINLGNPRYEMSILELAEMIKVMCNSSSEIIFRPRPADEPSRRRPDILKAKRILNWEPNISLVEGLERTIAWFREKGTRQKRDNIKIILKKQETRRG